MTKHFAMRNVSGTSSSFEILKGYMLICRNAEGVRDKRKVGTPELNRKRGNQWQMSNEKENFVEIKRFLLAYW